MGDSPYRSAKAAEDRFGVLLQTFGRSKLASLRLFFFAAVVLIAAASSFARAFDLLSEGTPEDAGSGLVAIFIAVIAASLAVILMASGIRARSVRLELREFGVVLRRRGGEAKVLWDDIAELKLAVFRVTGGGERHQCTIVAKDGQRLELGDDIKDFDRVRTAVEEETVRRLLPPAAENLEAGKSISFGAYALTKRGLSHRGKTLDWKDVPSAVLVRGVVAVGSKSHGIRLLPKRDGVMAWAKENAVDVPNAPVMIALVARLADDGPAVQI